MFKKALALSCLVVLMSSCSHWGYGDCDGKSCKRETCSKEHKNCDGKSCERKKSKKS